VTTATDALETLQPIDVLQAKDRGLDIVAADHYAGDGADFDGSQLGDAIIRQGEWYLIPMPASWEPDAPIYKAIPVANRDSKWDFPGGVSDYHGVDDVTAEFPEDCPECGASQWELEARQPSALCLDCDTSFAFGSYDPDDFISSDIAERYDMATDALDSHVPRDLAVTADPDAMYVRGTFRHVDNEHKMINLRDRWHLAAENTRDVTVFDLGADTGNIARYE
jgi:hypothetical protein